MKYISYTPMVGNKAQEKYRFLIHGKIITGWMEGETHLNITFKAASSASATRSGQVVEGKPAKEHEWSWRGEKSGIDDYEDVIAYLVSLKLPGHPDPGSRQVPDRKVKGYGLPGPNQPPLF